MNLKSQVTSQGLSEKLKEAGFPQGESYFVYCLESTDMIVPRYEVAPYDEGATDEEVTQYFELHDEYLDAHTVAELGEVLPEQVRSWRYKAVSRENEEWCCEGYVYGDDGWATDSKMIKEQLTEAEARGLMALWLLETRDGE